MPTIYKDVEVEINTDDIWEEVLDDMSTEDIEDYLKERRKKERPTITMGEAESALLSIAQLRLSPNLLCCKDSVKRTINEIMDELW
nr:MAG TPA: hypothetical protein [Caudoviricetes sp.]